MEKVTGSNFDKGFADWQAYQQAPWGKLRYRLAQANLQQQLPPPPVQENLTKSSKYVETFDTNIQCYSDDELKTMLQACGFTLVEQYGIRAICDFMADNERKFEPDFYEQLEQLDLAVSNKHPYKLLARFYHFVCQK